MCKCWRISLWLFMYGWGLISIDKRNRILFIWDRIFCYSNKQPLRGMHIFFFFFWSVGMHIFWSYERWGTCIFDNRQKDFGKEKKKKNKELNHIFPAKWKRKRKCRLKHQRIENMWDQRIREIQPLWLSRKIQPSIRRNY